MSTHSSCLLFLSFFRPSCPPPPPPPLLLSLSLLSLVCGENHVRTWTVTRFRGRISTQPGSVPIASFKVLSLEGPHSLFYPINSIGRSFIGLSVYLCLFFCLSVCLSVRLPACQDSIISEVGACIYIYIHTHYSIYTGMIGSSSLLTNSNKSVID